MHCVVKEGGREGDKETQQTNACVCIAFKKKNTKMRDCSRQVYSSDFFFFCFDTLKIEAAGAERSQI